MKRKNWPAMLTFSLIVFIAGAALGTCTTRQDSIWSGCYDERHGEYYEC